MKSGWSAKFQPVCRILLTFIFRRLHCSILVIQRTHSKMSCEHANNWFRTFRARVTYNQIFSWERESTLYIIMVYYIDWFITYFFISVRFKSVLWLHFGNKINTGEWCRQHIETDHILILLIIITFPRNKMIFSA